MNNNKQDKWVNELKHRLDNYSESVDEDSFVLLKKKIDERNKLNAVASGQEVAGAKVLRTKLYLKKRKIIFWSSGVAAAALLCLFLIMSRTNLNNDLNIKNFDLGEINTIQIPKPTISTIIPSIKVIKHVSNHYNLVANAKESHIINAREEIIKESRILKNDISEYSSKDSITHVKEDSTKNVSVSVNKNILNNNEYLLGNNYQYINNTDKYVNRNNYSIALVTGGGAMINNSSNFGTNNYKEMRFCCNMLNFDNVLYTNNTPVYTDYNFDYKVPLTFGLLFRKNITETLFALESGVQLTKMSTHIEGSENKQADCDFIYIGLPLKFSYTIISKSKFSSYISLGFIVEKCVSTNYKGEDMIYFTNDNKVRNMSVITPEDMPWQLSNTLSFGVQGRLTSSASIFVEPGLIYYYKTKDSLIPNMRKEYPFNINMVFGLRFNL